MAKRIKTVFKNTIETCHMFNSQSQDYGTNPGKNVYFEGDTIYSYGSHYVMARIYKDNGGVILVNSDNYSNTTAKHHIHLLSATRERVRFSVPYPAQGCSSENKQHFQDIITNCVEGILNQRTASKWNLENLKDAVNKFNKFCIAFGDKERVELPRELLCELTHVVRVKQRRVKELKRTAAERAPLLEAARLKREAAKEAKRQVEQAEKYAEHKASLKDWLEFKGHIKHSWSFNTPVLLRVNFKEKTVETSQGATVPLSEAISLAKRVMRGEKPLGEKIGPFTVDALTSEAIEIGCHTIPLNEVKRVFA